MKKSMKHWVIILAVFVLAFASLTVSAKTTYKYGSKNKVYKKAFYTVVYQGKEITSDVAPALMINDNVMVPYKTALVANGPRVKAVWKASCKRLTVTYEDKTLKLYLNKKYMHVNGKKKKLNTAPLKAVVEGKGYIMVPLKAVTKALGLNYTYVKAEKKVYLEKPAPAPTLVSTAAKIVNGLTTKQLSALSTAQFIKTLGPIAQEDNKKTGILASVTLAQAINESGWGKTTLAQKGNNIFGMKIRLSENTWAGSVWDGKSTVTIKTTEEYKGKKVSVYADFRKYPNVNMSIADHSAYLVGAKNGSKKRYAGITGTKSYATQLSILQKGGYCTWSSYVSELTSLIKKYNLTAYDVK